MLRSHALLKNIFDVMCGNVIALLASIVNGFVLPYVLGAKNYGYYRIFVLYSTYTALLHCGFVDGVLLRYGGCKYNDLKKKSFELLLESLLIFNLLLLY